MDIEEYKEVFPLGAHLCREPMPLMSELKKDMENLKSHGFNLVKLQDQWCNDEPEEGKFDFSVQEEIVEYAAKLDMGVYLGLTCEQAPGWLFEKFPDSYMLARDGRTAYFDWHSPQPADGKPGPCFDHPGAMNAQLTFIRKLVETLGRFENIVVWNTWQEVIYWSEHFIGQHVCYCENTIRSYQEWLKKKYNEIDRLNAGWKTRYTDWDQIQPSRHISGKLCIIQDIEWKYFMDNIQMANTLRRRYETIKTADSLDRPVFAHLANPEIGSGMDWSYARCQDFLGTSCYPAWFSFTSPWDDIEQKSKKDRFLALKDEMRRGVAMRFDHLRSCNPQGNPLWGAEYQGGPVSTGFHKGREPSAEDIRRWMLTSIGAGMSGISFWVTRAEIMAEEPNGFSLLDSTGDSTERFKEASRIGKALNKYPDLFAQSNLEPAKIAILVNEENFQLTRCMKQGFEHLPYATMAWYSLLWDAGYPVDLLEITGLDDKDIANYSTVINPFPYSLSDETAELLSQYVYDGGNLICEAAPGRLDQFGYCRRGEISAKLAELFGVKQQSFKMVREPNDGKRWSPIERTWGEFHDETMLQGVGKLKDHSLRANVYIETYEETDSEPVLKFNGKTAGTFSKRGKGTAWLLGTFPGHNALAYQDEESCQSLLNILAQCGNNPAKYGELLLRKRVSDKKEAWILTNPTQKSVTETLNVNGFSNAISLLDGNILICSGKLEVTLDSLDVKILILE